jgi:hypothetical protein
MGLPYGGVVTMDDWYIDLYFRGLKTGKTVHRVVHASPQLTEREAVTRALKQFGLHRQMGRVISARTRRNWQVYGSKAKMPDPVRAFVKEFAG